MTTPNDETVRNTPESPSEPPADSSKPPLHHPWFDQDTGLDVSPTMEEAD